MIIVKKDESIDSALRRFKKEVARSGVLKDLKKREAYIPPSEKRKIKRNEARKRAKKNNRD